MNELLEWLKDLPIGQLERTRVASPVSRMGRLNLLSRLTMNIISEAHTYSVRQVVKTTEQAERFKQEYEGDLPTEVEAAYQSLTDKYLTLMEAIPHQFALRLLQELERAPATRTDDGPVSRLRAFFGE